MIRTGGDEGVAFILVLFLLVLITSIVVPFLFVSQVDATLAGRRALRVQADYAMRGALAHVQRTLARDAADDAEPPEVEKGEEPPAPTDDLLEDWSAPGSVTIGGIAVRYRVEDERGRFPLHRIVDGNGRPDDVWVERLDRMLDRLWGGEIDVDDAVERIVDWMDAVPAGGEPEEEDTDLFTGAPNRRIWTLRELRMIPDLPPGLVGGTRRPDPADPDTIVGLPGLLDLATRWGDGRINVNTVPYDVLIALSPHLEEAQVDAVMEARAQAPFESIDDLMAVPEINANFPPDSSIGDELGGVLVYTSTLWRVHLLAESTEGTPTTIATAQAILLRSGGEVSLLSWDTEAAERIPLDSGFSAID